MGDHNINELERQTEKASIFTHSVLTEQIARQNESDTFLYGLIDYLINKGIVLPDELLDSVRSVKKEVLEKGETAILGVSIRKPESDNNEFVPVNCGERLHICKGACCKLSFCLSVSEIEDGNLKWDLGRPYFIRRQSNGYCHHLNNETKCCTIYNDRPPVCRKYSCANDERIWIDFDKMILNEKWISEHLGDEKLHLIEAMMI